MPLRRVRHSSLASAMSSSPARAAARKSIVAAAATVLSLCELQANAKALSASAKTIPPWQTPWPLSMSARTVMTTRAHPGRTPVMRMPSACEARSSSNSRAAARSARRCPASTASGGTPMARSATREARRALLGEGCDPFRVIHAVTELALVVALDIQLLRQRAAQTLVDRLLGVRQSAGRCGGELPRQTLDHRSELAVFDATPDQPPGGGLLGAELVAEEREPERARRADQARQSPRAPRIRHEAQLRECLHEARRACGDHQITGERNVGAGPGGHAVDRCNHRQRQGTQREHQGLVVLLDRCGQVRRRTPRRDRPIVEVLTGAEAPPRSG